MVLARLTYRIVLGSTVIIYECDDAATLGALYNGTACTNFNKVHDRLGFST